MRHWRQIATLFVTCAAILPNSASVAAVPAAERQQTTVVFVELVVNGQRKPELVELEISGNRMTMAGAALRGAGIAIEGDGPIDLDAAGLLPRYDSLRQSIDLTAPLGMLPTSRRAGAARERVLAQAATGAALNYDAFVQTSGSVASLSLWSEQRLFGALGNISNTGVVRATIGTGDGEARYLRYDTRFRRVDPDRALAVTVGDLITGGLSWTQPLRLGGVQIGRNFRSRPDLVTTPLPSFAGEAAVPSAVDLFIDGYRQQRQSVEPGRFVLEDMPVVSGAGVATIVTTDAVGRQIATNIPFYVAPDLLRPGLTDFSAELGFVRKGFGLTSFGYGMAAATGFFRRGISDRLTIEAHGEASPRSATVGAGAVWMPGLFGTLHANLVASRADRIGGSQVTIGYQYGGKRWSFAAEHRRRSDRFRTLADFDLLGLVSGGSSSRAVASVNLDRFGSIGIGYLDARPRASARTQLATASWSLPVTQRISAFVSGDYDLRSGAASAQIRLSIPLGGGSAGIGVSRDPVRGFTTQAEYSRTAPYAGGIGIAAGVALDERGGLYGQGNVTARTSALQLNAGASVADGRSAAWGSASGSLVLIDGSIFAANDTSDAFAIVSTSGVAGVPVYYENQRVGMTDKRGHVLVPRIPAYHASSFTIDPMQLDAGLMPGAVQRRIAVAEGSAAIVNMPIRAVRSATLGLIDADGNMIEPGSTARLVDGSTAVVGWDGILYLEDVSLGQTIAVTRIDGGRCQVEIDHVAGLASLAHREGVPCL